MLMNDLAFLQDLFGNSKGTKLLIYTIIFVWCLLRQRNGGSNSGLKPSTIVTDAFNIDILLSACPLYRDSINKEMFDIVQTFIIGSNRFLEWLIYFSLRETHPTPFYHLFSYQIYKKRLLLRCIHLNFKLDLINNMDHICISDNEHSSVIY